MRWHEIVAAVHDAAQNNELNVFRLPNPDRCRDDLVLSPSTLRVLDEKTYATEYKQKDLFAAIPVHPAYQWQEVAVNSLREVAGKNPLIKAVFAKYQGASITGVDVLAELIAALELAHEKGKI